MKSRYRAPPRCCCIRIETWNRTCLYRVSRQARTGACQSVDQAGAPNRKHQNRTGTIVFPLNMMYFYVCCLYQSLLAEWESAVPWPTFPNHRGANNQPELSNCMAGSQTLILVKHPVFASAGFHWETFISVECSWRGEILRLVLPSRVWSQVVHGRKMCG